MHAANTRMPTTRVRLREWSAGCGVWRHSFAHESGVNPQLLPVLQPIHSDQILNNSEGNMENIDLFWTIVSGLVIGVRANILTPFVARIWARFSESARVRNEVKGETFRRSVQYLIENPMEEINLRTEKNGRYVIALILLAVSLILPVNSATNATLSGGLLSDILFAVQAVGSLISLVLGLIVFIQARKYESLVSAAWLQRKRQHPDIDLD
jgi:hypothetical protein